MKEYENDNEFNSNENNNSNKSSKVTLPKIIIYALVFGAIASIAFRGFNAIGNSMFGTSTPSTTVSSTNTISSSGNSTDVAKVAKECLPSIVSITNMTIQEVQGFYSFFYGGGDKKQYEQKSVGSGIIVGKNNSELLIVTNNHVVEGATTLTVAFYGDDENPVNASLKGTASDKDLAVIAVNLKDIKDDMLEKIKIATLGDSKKLEIGENAIAIGNALGYGTSVTSGIISAVDRKIASEEASPSSFFDFFGDGSDSAIQQESESESINGTFIQTDAAINPGNSGGALLNSKGEVIGINSAKIVSTGAEGMGYAIPISDAKPIIEDLMNNKTREVVAENERGYLGIGCKDIDSETSKAYGMPKGIYISQVNKGEAADNAGLQKGDIITKVNDDTVSTTSDIQKKLSYYKVGEKINIEYQRMNSKGNYRKKTCEVTLTKMSKEN